MPALILWHPARGASCFASSSVVAGPTSASVCAKHACCVVRPANYAPGVSLTSVPRVSMVVEGCDSTKVSETNFSAAESGPSRNSPITNEESELLPSNDSEPHMHEAGGLDARVVIAGGALVCITVGILVAMGTGVLSGDSFISLAAWFQSRGQSAVILYALLYFALELVAVPALPLTLGSGYLFGITTGTAAVSVASTAAATAAFLISRYGLRDYISSIAVKYPRFRAMDRAIGKEGFKFVFLLRLSPLLPFSISNYLYGLTSVKLGEFVFGSWLGMLPGTIAYVSAGAAIDALTDLTSKKHSVNPVLVGVGLVATIAVLFFVGRLAGNVVEAEGEFNESV